MSSKPQAQKASLAEQERAGREWTELAGGQVTRVYRVPGHTRDLWNWAEAEAQMDAYRQLREDCEAGVLDVLWCYDTDRLGRDPALAQQVASLCQKCGVSLFVESGNYLLEPGASPQRFMFAFQSTQAGVEQQKRVHRHRFGMRGRVEDGLHPNHWPYGYRPVRNGTGEVVGGEFEPTEIGAVRQMTRWYLDGLGYTAIAARLNKSDWTPRRAEKWWPATVRYMLLNDTYAGVVSFGDAQSEKSDKFPAVWDAETWRAIRRERDGRSVGGKEPVSPISGVAFCARCGYALDVVSHYADGDARLQCRSHHRSWTGAYEKCHRNTTKESVVLDFVDALLERLARSPDALALYQREAGGENWERQAQDAQTAVDKVREQQKRLGLRVAEGVIGVEAAKLANDELARKLDAARATRDAALERLRLQPDPDEIRAALLALGGSVRDGPLEAVRAALKRARLRVYVEDGAVVDAEIG